MGEHLPVQLLSSAEARTEYDLGIPDKSRAVSEVDRQLAEGGIAKIEMNLSPQDFQRLTSGLDVCIAECPELLSTTYHLVDPRRDSTAGYVRKDRKINQAGVQIEDPKSLFHFAETARQHWGDQLKHGPQIIKDFLADGFEIQNVLLGIARQQVQTIEPSHPNISKLYFPPSGPSSLSFLRVLSYDGYSVDGEYAAVAKPHYDRGGFTIQAHADAAGFWASADGPRGDRRHFDTQAGEAYLFAGSEHAKAYGDDSYIHPLWHGVDRVIPAGVTLIPNRHAVILFVDAPLVNHDISVQDTMPHIYA